MTPRLLAVVLLGSALMLGSTSRLAAQSAQPPSVELPSELDRVLRDYERAWRARDASAIAALFVDSAVVLTNTGVLVSGRQAVEARYAGSGGGLSLRAVSFAVDGAVAHIVGAYAESSGSPDAGSYVLALRRDRTGRWLIAADLDRPYPRSSQ